MIKKLLILLALAGFPALLSGMNLPKDTLELAKEWFEKIGTYDNEGDTKKADEAARKALSLASLVKDHLLMGRCMNYLAINLSAEGKRDEGIAMSYQAFENLMLAGDTTRAANVKINLGMDYTNNGNYEEALKVELEALELRFKCKDSSNIATYYQHIGEVYKELGIHDKWKSSLETAHRLSANPRYASFATQISILNDFGGIYETEKKYDEAIKVYLEMYERSRKEKYLNGMATALTNLSPVYRKQGQNNKALMYAKEALEIQQKRQNNFGILTAFNQIGEAYLALGQPGSAFSSYSNGLSIATRNNYISEQKESLKGLYRVARTQNNWKEALIFHERYSQLSDSLQNIDLQEKLANIETKYQSEKKGQQIELLNSENELKNERIKVQKIGIWSGSLIILITATFTFLAVRQRRRRQLTLQNELEQKLLRSQMNPHFIFNSLGAIQNFMMKNEGRKAAFYLSSFSSLMRSILKNSREELISLHEEMQTLENYLNLHQLRLGEKLTFTVTISEDLDAESTFLPPMLIQPFVENAILHGIEKLEENGRIEIAFREEKNQLKITIEDNGPGFDQAGQKENHISYALKIFKERISNLKKTMGIEVDYYISSKSIATNQNRGTLVTVNLTLK